MKTLGVALLLTVLLAGSASAAYGAGSTLEADAPVTLEGRVDSLVQKGFLAFVSEGKESLDLSLKAAELTLRNVTVPPSCPPTAVPTCPPEAVASTRPVEDVHELRDVTLTVVRPLGGFQVVLANDPGVYGGAMDIGAGGGLVATTSTGTLLTTHPAAFHLSPYGKGWATEEPDNAATGDVYTSEPGTGAVNSTAGGSVRGVGGFQALLQGALVRVRGTEDGRPFDVTYELPMPDSADDPVRFLEAQTATGLLNANSRAPLAGHGVSLAEATVAAVFKNARGELVVDGEKKPVDEADLRLAGPISLTLNKVVDGTPQRMAFAVGGTLRISTGLLPPPEDEESGNTPALVAAGAAGAGGMGLLAAAAYFWPRLKFGATLLLLPLYSRIERTAVLEHEKRDEIYALIRATPGIHAHEIGEKAKIGWGTTVYHLKLLEQHNLIVSQKSGRYKRFFVNTGEFTKKKDVYGALRNETAKAVAQYIAEHPGVTQKDLCAALNIQPSLASWHVEKLEGVELVKRVKDGRMVRYFAGPAWSQVGTPLPRGPGEGVAET